jgi:hypothetical protein
MIRTIACLVFLTPWLGWSQQQPPAQRDLRIEKDVSRRPRCLPPTRGSRDPRSYALVIGISEVPHLTPGQQLQYAGRDAEAIYSV